MKIDKLTSEDCYKLLYPVMMTLANKENSRKHYKHWRYLTQEDVELLIDIIRENSSISLNTIDTKQTREKIKYVE